MNDALATNGRSLPEDGLRRRALLVLGMHRSGTSATTRVLNILGADLPTRTVGPDQSNAAGYWEPPELYRLHDQMLARAGSRWDDWQPFDWAALEEVDVLGVMSALLDFHAREFRDSHLFVIKDPRICRFPRLWLEILERFSAAPYAVIPVRHPFAVAQSLRVRDGFSFAKSYLVWLRHVIDAEYGSRGIPRTFVDYDCLLDDWRTQVGRMAEELGITWPNTLPDVQDVMDRFLSNELRHHAATGGELEGDQNVVSWIRRAYAAVQAFARCGDSETVRREMDQVRVEFDNACLAFGGIWREERVRFAQETLAPLGFASSRTLDGHVQRIDDQLKSLQADIRDVRDHARSPERLWSLLQESAERQQQTIAMVQERADDARRLAGVTSDAAADLDLQFRRLAEDVRSREAAVEAIDGRLADRQAAIEQTMEAQARRIADLEAALADSSQQAVERVRTSAERHDALQRLIEDQARRVTELEAACVASTARQADEHAQTARQIDAQAARLTRLQFGLDGAVSRVDAITARTFSARFGSVGRRLRHRLLGAGRAMERAVRRLRKGVVRATGLQGLRESLARRRVRRECREIRSSGLFDEGWYLGRYPDVTATGIDPVMHYMTHGVREGRWPNPLFDTHWYLARYHDVAAAGGNPLLHYLRHGAAEGRDPSPLFQTAAYAALHPKLRSLKQNPLVHRLQRADTAGAVAAASDPDPTLTSTAEHGQASPETNLAGAASTTGADRLADLAVTPLVSVIVPVYDTPPALLEKMIQSVERQVYRNWELCLVDDASPASHVRAILERAAARDPRIRAMFRPSNGNISAATNTGIAMARGEFVAFLDHDDELTADALFEVVRLLNEEPETDVIYTDQDKIDTEGRRSEPFHKPAWSPAYLQSVMYVGHLLVVRSTLLERIGGCDSAFDGVQDFELMLRLGEATKRIRHIPRILYHWRKITGSIASNPAAKPGIAELQRKAVQAHLDRLGVPAVATTNGSSHRVRVGPGSRDREPLVSILIPSKDHPELIGPCLRSLFEKTAYGAFEVVVGDNETTDPEALGILDRYPVSRVPLPGPFRFAAFNNRMADRARGEYLLLLNNDTEIVQPNWLDTLLLYAEQDDVGAVGPLLLYGDGTVQHAGVILGPRGTADHVMRGFPGDSDGYAGSLQAAREVTAVTGACLLVRRDHYLACGGLNETFGRHYEDVDFCLRLRKRGLRNVFVGSARLLHHESKSRGSSYDFTDRVLLLDHWEPLITRGDPYYNPAFDLERVDYSVRIT